MSAQAIVVKEVAGQLEAQLVPLGAELVAWMEARGHRYLGPATGRVLRPELRGAPRFEGLAGPCWGGAEHPLRYECWAAYRRIST